jgi:hypothetical protein
MPAVYWCEAVMTAVHLLNHSLTIMLNGRTTYEAWHGRKSAVSYLRIFGWLAFFKLDDRSSPRVFISYVEGPRPTTCWTR